MSAQAEMQKAQQKFEFEMQKEQMKEVNDNAEHDKDRQLQLAKKLMNLMQQQNNANSEGSEQSSEKENNMSNENVEDTGNAQMEQEAQLQQILEHIMSIPPEEQQAILEQHPELVQVMSLMQGTPTM